MRYAGALVFSDDLSRVVLLRKARPDWLAGRWCFPGGHVEQGETARAAARRELLEETGVEVAPTCLLPLVQLIAPARVTTVFWIQGDHYLDQARTLTDEDVRVWRVWDAVLFRAELAPSIDWMLLMVGDSTRASQGWAQVPIDFRA